MVSSTEWFTDGRDGKFQINSITIYKNLSSEIVTKLDNNLSISEILNWIKNETIKAFNEKYAKSPQVGALNNAVGRWNEFIATSLLSEIVYDLNQETEECIAVFSLPNSQVQREGVDEAYSKFLSLFRHDDFATGKALAKLTAFRSKIFLPSPDYIIAVLKDKEISISVQPLLKQQAKKLDSLELYNFLKGKLHIKEFKAAASLKTSNRPDRRYQPLFEAAMIKAMGYVLQQNWQYYMVASELSSADRTIFTTAIAPHGIALEQDFKLVDGTYPYSRKEDLVPLIQAAIQI